MLFTAIQAPNPAILKVGDLWKKEKTGEVREWNGVGWVTPKDSRSALVEKPGDPETGRPLTEEEVEKLTEARRQKSLEDLSAEEEAERVGHDANGSPTSEVAK